MKEDKSKENKEEKKESLCLSAEALAKADDKKIEELEKQKNEYLEGWKRTRAEFLNYKKEEMERIGDLLKYASEELILKILPILDNFEIAEKEVRSIKYEETKYKEIINGLLQIKNQILDFLKSQGVEEIKCLGQKFDPNFHEVVEEITETGSLQAKESGRVVEEIQKGYTLYGKVIRPAKVKVTK